MAEISLRSNQQILGQMIARLLAETDLTDLSPGSIFLTILEAASSSDFTIEGKLLQLINIRNLDKAKGVDLENLAAEMGVTPSRLGANPARVKLQVTESSFSKVSTTIFAGAVSPAAGDTTLKVTDATGFFATGTIYIGRGSPTSESISYVSVANSGSYWTFTLASPLTKDHLVGEEVVLAQGGDRQIPAVTVVRVPAIAGNPAIEFSTLVDAVLADGEDTIDDIDATANEPGIQGNVGLNKIIEFSSLPWSTAEVSNPKPATSGADTETDAELRQRVKDHVHELGRGTQRAIIRTVIGVNDPDEGKRVVSAFLKEPTSAGALGILFIDDGTGFAPSFAGVGEEVIVTSAAGTEQFFQLQQAPLLKAQAVSIGQEPFAMQGGERILFEVDGQFEERAISGDNYRSPGVVAAQEIVEAINQTFTTVEARAKDGRIFISPVADDPDYIRIGVPTSDNANEILRFPTTKAFTLRLYKNDRLLEKNGAEALIQSFANTAWPPFSASETLQLKIDGIDSPVITFLDADFALLTSSTAISGASAVDWAKVINAKFIGVKAIAQDDGTFIIKSNQGKSSDASLSVLGGSLSGALISASASSVGKSPEFKLNRLLGQIETTERLDDGDELKAGNVNTAGFVDTSELSSFDLSTVLGSDPQMVVITEAPCEFPLFDQLASPLTFSSASSSVQTITGATGQFSNILADDWVHTYNLPRSALLRVKSVANDGSSVSCFDPDPVTGPTIDTPDGNEKTIVFFRSEGLPQQITLPSGVSVMGSDVVDSINEQLSGGTATLLDSNAIRIQTDRLEGEGALAIPVLAGSAINLGFVPDSFESNDPHTAAMESGDLAGLPSGRLVVSVDDTTVPYDDLQVSGTPFGVEHSNRPVLTYLGASARLIREPLERLTTSRLTLRNDPPNPAVGLGPDMRGITSAGCEFGESDNMVFIIDDDAAKKTFDIPMYVPATVAAPAVPSTTQFDAADSVGDLLGSSTRWLDHRFSDYRVWFKARADMPFSVPDTQLRIASVQFGPNGKNIKFGIFYPSVPSSPATASFQMDATNAKVLITMALASGAERAIGLTPSVPVYISYTGPLLGLYEYTLRFLPPVDLSSVLIGDILTVNDSAFSSANRGQMKVTSITNLVDSTRTYEFMTEDLSSNSVTGATAVTLGSAPTQAAEVGDRLVATAIKKQITFLTVNTVTVNTGGAFTAGAGSFEINATPFTYTSYTSGSGVFAGVSPDPIASGAIVGDFVIQDITPVSRDINNVGGPTSVDVDAPGFTDGDGYEMTIEHQALTLDAPPSFTAAVGDLIQAGSQILEITSIVSTSIFHVDVPFAFTGPQAGTISRLLLTGDRSTVGVNEQITTTSSQSVRVMELDTGSNLASALITAINGTAGVKDLILASNATGSSGSGTVDTSTEEELADGNTRVSLQNGESFVYSSVNASPAITLKVPTDLVLEVGEEIRFLPMTPMNIKDHFERKQISGLSIAANIDLVNLARRVQVSSKVSGGIGQVFAVGGKASGNNVLAVRNTGLSLSSTVGQLELDRSALDLLVPGHTIKIAQPGRARKSYVGSAPISSTNVTISIASPGVGQITFGVPLAAVIAYTHTGTVVWSVRKLSRGRVRFEVLSGTASLPGTLKAGDWVFVGNGDSYAGTTPATFFATANQGYFQVRETDATLYFDIDAEGSEQFVSATSAPFIFIPYHSALPGDQLQIADNSPLVTDNQGSFEITEVISATVVRYINADVVAEGAFALGTSGTDSIRVLDHGYSTYRKIMAVSPSVNDPTNRSTIVVFPGYDISLLNEGQGAKVTLPNRLGFGTDPVPGVSGYQYWTGLKRRVQRTLDGYEPDSVTFEGVRAAGVAIEAREPQIQRVTLNIKVKTREGVALAAISDSIKSSVVGFINSLGLSQDVILSEVVSIIQATSGVDSVVLVDPSLEQERITINDNAIARTSPSEVTLS